MKKDLNEIAKYEVAISKKYGKDAYKSRAFGVSPEESKRKTKPKIKNKI